MLTVKKKKSRGNSKMLHGWYCRVVVVTWMSRYWHCLFYLFCSPNIVPSSEMMEEERTQFRVHVFLHWRTRRHCILTWSQLAVLLYIFSIISSLFYIWSTLYISNDWVYFLPKVERHAGLFAACPNQLAIESGPYTTFFQTHISISWILTWIDRQERASVNGL